MKPLFTFVALFFAHTTFSQSIVSVSPDVVAPGTITGTISFEGNLTFWNTGAGLYQIVLAGPNDTIWPASQNIIDDTHAEATYLIPTSADTGCYDVRAYDIIADTVWLLCGMTVSNTAGMDDLSSISQVRMYPNPLLETSILEIETTNNNEFTVDFYDCLGKKTKTIVTSQSQIEINRKNFNNGVYYYNVSTPEGIIGRGKLLVK